MKSSHGAMTAKLAILGSYPPPYGGVGVHVQRLLPILQEAGVPYVVYNATSDAGDGRQVIAMAARRRTWLLRYLFGAREPAIYILSDRLVAWLIGALLASWRGKRVALRLRNAALPDWCRTSPLRRRLARFSLGRMSAVVCVSQALAETARELGAKPGRVYWVPGFLPPPAEMLSPERIGESDRRFIAQHSPVLAANGKVDWYGGQDLYGLDMLIELAARLKTDHPTVGIVVSLAERTAEAQRYLDELMNTARRLGVDANVRFSLELGEFVPVAAAADVFLRPTNTDGDAISLRECLYLGLPCVASDAVERPEGTIIFRTRDMDDFECKARQALALVKQRSARPTPVMTRAEQERINGYVNLLARLANGGDDLTSAALPVSRQAAQPLDEKGAA